GVLSLDPQLISYSWATGIPDVAVVAFVRKHAPEIQYLKASISEEQRQEFGRLVETTVSQIEAGHFARGNALSRTAATSPTSNRNRPLNQKFSKRRRKRLGRSRTDNFARRSFG